MGTLADLVTRTERDEEARAKEGNIDALNAAIIERDAARAALERVRATLTGWERALDEDRHHMDHSTISILSTLYPALRADLEGES